MACRFLVWWIVCAVSCSVLFVLPVVLVWFGVPGGFLVGVFSVGVRSGFPGIWF